SVGFRRLSRESVLPCGVRTFLEPKPAVTRPANRILPAFPPPGPSRAGRARTPDSAQRRRRAARTRRTPGTRATRRAAARAAPARASGAGRSPPSELPEDPHDLAEDLHVRREDRLERGVLRLEAHAVAVAVERLDGRLVGRLVVTRERHDDLAVAGVL